MTHVNAPFAPEGRLRLARLIVDGGWSARRAAERFQCSPATASKWAARYRSGLPMTDRSSRPRRSPTRLPRRSEHRIVALRFTRRWGPHRIGYHLHLNRSTVERVLARYRMPKLVWLDQATGLPARRPKPVRYEKSAPGELVHVDIKKQGRIPDGGGHRVLGRQAGVRTTTATGRRGAVMLSCTTRSTTTLGSPTPRSSPTRRRRPPQDSGSAPTPSSQLLASRSSRS